MLVILFTTVSLTGNAQDPDAKEATIPLDHFYADPINGGLRNFLSKFHFSLSTGYGHTFYKQDLSDFNLLQQANQAPFIFRKDLNINGGSVSTGYSYWFNRIEAEENRAFNTGTDFLVSSDTSDLAFKGGGMSIPLNFSIHYEFDRYKIGAGYMFEYHRPSTMSPTVFSDQINTYEPDFNSTFYQKYYIMFGAKVYRYYYWVLSVDAHLGGFNLSGKFDKAQVQKGLYFNIGTTIEREMSEYLRFFVRPSFDLKSFTLEMPETDVSIRTGMNALYVNFGVTYRISRLKRCFLKNCKTQVNHQHGNMEYRSRVHPFYKNQNPHHGENYPTLIKYKGKNKKKMNAY
jgi:hypothetical protein